MDIATCHTFYNNNRLASSLVPRIGQRMDSKGAKLGDRWILVCCMLQFIWTPKTFYVEHLCMSTLPTYA